MAFVFEDMVCDECLSEWTDDQEKSCPFCGSLRVHLRVEPDDEAAEA
jgi:rRNA maturation endonuclease Nob1